MGWSNRAGDFPEHDHGRSGVFPPRQQHDHCDRHHTKHAAGLVFWLETLDCTHGFDDRTGAIHATQISVGISGKQS